MSWNRLISEKERELVRSSANIKRIWEGLQNDYWLRTEKLIDGMNTTKNGRLVFSLANIQKASKVSLIFGLVWRAQRRSIIRAIIDRFATLIGLQAKAVKEIGVEVPKSSENEVLNQLLQAYGYKDNKVVPGSLFDALNPGTDLTADIARRLQNALIMGLNKDDFRTQFRNDFNDPNSGFAMRYYSRWTRDLFFQFDRATAKALANKLNLQHAVYAGTLKDNTREFCEERLNRVYTTEEIASWNKKEWKGKNRTVPVELACGGYNCRHTLNYITPELAEVLGERQGGINTYNQDVILD